MAFLDGTNPSNQIAFDTNGSPISVASSFASQVNTSNTETAFGSPHGMLPQLVTTSQQLSAGSHTILFEIGDVNDHILDSAVFLTNFRATAAGPGGGPGTGNAAPEPSSIVLGLFGAAAGIFAVARKRMNRRTV